MIVGVGFVFLLVVALGGYFFVYPRLGGVQPEPVATAEPSEPSPGSESPIASSGLPAAPAPASESEPTSFSPAANGELPESRPEVSTADTAQPDAVAPAPADAGSREPTWKPRTRPNQPTSPGAASSRNPEPVSAPVVTAPEPERASLAAEPADVEPTTDSVDRSPSAAEESDAGQVSAARQPPLQEKPAYQGPKRGVVIWSGDVDKGTTVVIDGESASIGRVQGSLPGVACMVRLSAQNVAVTEGPGPRNGYRRISLRFNKKGRFSVPVEWEVLH